MAEEKNLGTEQELDDIVAKLESEKLELSEYEKILNLDSGVNEEQFKKVIKSENCDFSISVFRYNLLIFASYKGFADSVPFLLKKIDPGMYQSESIRQAATTGQAEIVKLLLADSRTDPTGRRNDAIRMAAENGHHNVVKVLLGDQRVDPTANGNLALKQAQENGHVRCVKLLMKNKAVRKLYNEEHPDSSDEDDGETESSDDEDEDEDEESRGKCCIIM